MIHNTQIEIGISGQYDARDVDVSYYYFSGAPATAYEAMEPPLVEIFSVMDDETKMDLMPILGEYQLEALEAEIMDEIEDSRSDARVWRDEEAA